MVIGKLAKKNLKISKSGNRKRTDNTMAKRKSTKGQTMIYKILHRKLKIELHEPH
jgi:hypothetical protein